MTDTDFPASSAVDQGSAAGDVASSAATAAASGESIWWNALFSGMPAGEVAARIGPAVTELARRLERIGGAPALARVIEWRLKGMERRSFYNLVDGLFLLLGDRELANFVCYLATEQSAGALLADRADQDGTVGELQQVVAQYGLEINRAFDLLVRSPNDWLYVVKETRLDQLTGSMEIFVDIEKVNGEHVKLEAKPSSILVLTRHLIQALAALPAGYSFSEQVVGELSGPLQDLVNLIFPANAATSGGDAGGVDAEATGKEMEDVEAPPEIHARQSGEAGSGNSDESRSAGEL